MTVLDNLGWGAFRATSAPAAVAPMDLSVPAAIPLPAGLHLRATLVGADIGAVLAAWLVLRPTALHDVSLVAWAAGLGVAVLIALACLTSAGLYRSRVSSIR